MSCFLSMVTTRRTSVISLTVCVLGTSTSIPDWRIGAVIMKMISSTRTTSMNGTMLMSDRDVWVPLESCGMGQSETRDRREETREGQNQPGTKSLLQASRGAGIGFEFESGRRRRGGSLHGSRLG